MIFHLPGEISYMLMHYNGSFGRWRLTYTMSCTLSRARFTRPSLQGILLLCRQNLAAVDLAFLAPSVRPKLPLTFDLWKT